MSGYYGPNSINPNDLGRISFTVDTGAKTLDIGLTAPMKLWLPDAANPGSFDLKEITAPAQIKGDGHASENFNTGEVGTTLAVDWLSNYPLTWYLTIESGNIYWVCSRNPCMTQMPAAAGYIGDFSAEPATATTLQTNVFIAASVTVADFVDLPVWPIGTMPVQRAANSQIPTLVALTAGQDGAGLWNESKVWTMPLGQNGADAGGYVYAAAGTNPTFTAQSLVYYVNKAGRVDEMIALINSSGGTAGNGANSISIVQSHTSRHSEHYSRPGMYQNGSTRTFGAGSVSSDSSSYTLYSYATNTNVTQNDMNDANARRIYCKSSYQAF